MRSVSYFRERITVTPQRAQARAIHAHTARLEATSSSLSTLPARAAISDGVLMRLWGLLRFFCARVLVGRECHVIYMRESLLYCYLVFWHSFTRIEHLFVVT